jgi:TetR/AcrR family transcriptional regulator, repressor for uid operon
MSLIRASTSAAPKRTADAERRAHIVAAAERAFVRFGFHATTMQNVAEEAGMSAGNLYRYFPSKEAIVEGLCMADQVQRTEVFSELIGRLDLREALATTLREHLLFRPTEKARMIVEIWAEAGRNPRVAAITAAVDADVLAGLTKVLHAVGAAGATFDPEFAAIVIFTLVSGLFKRLALEPDFDREAAAAMALGVLEALLAGALAPALGKMAEGV